MKQTFKSFTKFYFRNWASLLGVILFTIASFSVLIGLCSSPLKIKKIVDNISQNYQKWDYSLSSTSHHYSDDVFLYDYLFNFQELGIPNAFDEPIINPAAQVQNDEGQTRSWTDQFSHAHKYYCEKIVNKNVTITKFMYWYLIHHLLAFENYDHGKVPLALDQDDEQFWIAAQDLFSPNWWEWLNKNVFNFTKIVNQDLVKTFNQSFPKSIGYESNYLINFEITNSLIPGPLNVRIDDLNFHQSDNVVTDLSDERLKQMKDNEVIINSSFAFKHDLKIGDSIKIANFSNFDGSPSTISAEYKIIGFGAKLTNLVARSSISGQNQETLILYLNRQELGHYLDYITFNQNVAYTPTGKIGEDFFWTRLKQRLKLINGPPVVFEHFANFLASLSLDQTLILRPYDEDRSLSFLNLLNIQIEIVLVIGLILLTFVVIFVNFFIGTKIRFLRHQIGIFKAFGYTSTSLSSIFGVLTFFTFLVCVFLGYGISVPLQIFTNDYFTQNLLIQVAPINFDVLFLCLLLIVVPVVLSLIAFLSAFQKINQPTLGLIYDGQGKKIKNPKHLHRKSNKPALNLWRMQQHFVSSAKGSHFLILVIFLFTSLLLILEFMIPSVLNQTTEQLIFYTQPSVDHQDGLIEEQKWFENNHKLDFQNRQNYDLQVFEYEQSSDLIKLAQSSDNELYQEIQNYLNIDRQNSADDPTEKIKNQFLKITNVLDINHQIIEITTIVQFLMMFEDDYLHFLTGDPIFEMVHQQVSQVWLPKFLELESHLQGNGKSTCLTFNNLYLKKDADILTFNLGLNSSANHNFYRNDFNLKLVDVDAKSFFKWKNVTESQWDELTNENNYHDFQIPVIVGNKLAQTNQVKINDQLKMKINNTPILFTLKVVGINQGDNQTPNIYSNLSYFKKHYFSDELLKLDLYNEIYSQTPLLNAHYLTKDNPQSAIFSNDFLNFIFFKEGDKNIKLSELFQNPNDLKSFVNLPFVNPDFRSFYAERLILNQKMQNMINLFLVIEYCEFIMTFVIVVYAITYLLEKRQKEILILKAFGYKNSEIIFLIFSSYLGIIWVSFLFAYGLLIGLLKVFEVLIQKLTLTSLTYLFPFGQSLIPAILVISLTIVIFLICLNTLKKQKLQITE